MQAALLTYEHLAYEGLRAPHRLPPRERDRFWLEARQFGILMGAVPEQIPTTCREVELYYAGIADRYGVADNLFHDLGLAPVLEMAREFSPSQLPELAPLLLSAAFTPQLIAVLPRPARRNLGIPAVLDPFLDTLLRLGRPAMRAFTFRPFGDAMARRVAGPDALALAASARRIQALAA